MDVVVSTDSVPGMGVPPLASRQACTPTKLSANTVMMFLFVSVIAT